MVDALSSKLARVLTCLTGALILEVTARVVWGYFDYFPPNFRADFLLGREATFLGAYAVAFYAHIVAGPVSLVLGLVLVSDWFRGRFTRWHRRLGKAQVAIVLLLLCPSGLWMARYAEGGSIAGAGFAALAIATGACVVQGWRTAVSRQFAAHRRWMLRCFVLLCSAVVLRLIGGTVAVTGVGLTWSYPAAAWASWLLPLAVFEASGWIAN